MEIQDVKSQIYSKKKKSGIPTKRYSNFFITINTQQSVWKMSKEDGQALFLQFKDLIEKFKNEDIHNFVVLTTSKEDEGKLKDIPLHSRVESAHIEDAIEIGPERGLLHAHLILKTVHRGVNFKLDYEGLHTYWHNQLNGCHFYCEVFRNRAQTLDFYIRKTERGLKY